MQSVTQRLSESRNNDRVGSPPAAASQLAPSVQGRSPRQIPSWVLSTLSVIFLIALWAGISMSGKLPPGYLPTPNEMGDELVLMLRDGYKHVPIWTHIEMSLFRTLSGFFIAVLIGVPLGLLTGSSRVAGAWIAPIMAFVRPIPPIAFIPMVVLYFGLGETGKVVLITWTAFTYVHVNAHAGAANVPISYMRAAQSLGLSRRQIFFRVVLFSAIPQIFTGLKVAMALSWAVVVAAELTGAQSGLGYMISDAALIFRIPVVFIGIVIIGAIGLLLNFIINFLESRFVHWRGR